jgi:hypothetical protein
MTLVQLLGPEGREIHAIINKKRWPPLLTLLLFRFLLVVDDPQEILVELPLEMQLPLKIDLCHTLDTIIRQRFVIIGFRPVDPLLDLLLIFIFADPHSFFHKMHRAAEVNSQNIQIFTFCNDRTFLSQFLIDDFRAQVFSVNQKFDFFRIFTSAQQI